MTARPRRNRRAGIGVARALGAAVLGIALLGTPDASAQVSDSRFSLKTIAQLAFPIGMQFTPSGDRLFVNERSGRIRIIKRGVLLSQPFATVGTTTQGEGGLLGLALHPDFERGQPWVYVFYTRSDGAVDRVERFKASGDASVQREIVFDGMPASQYHHGGSVVFGSDGKLYVSNGEAHNSNRAQDPNALGGKIYRLNADGSVPADNPFSGSATYALGLRNPFGMTRDPATGRLWATENGPSDHDEVNLIQRGGNYGWPVVKGKAGDPRFVDPVLDYPSIIVPTMATFGAAPLPSEYRGNLFFGSYKEEAVHRVVLNSAHTAASRDEIFIRPGEEVVGMTMGPDGLYFTTPTKVVRASAPTTTTPKPAPKKTTPPPASPTPSPPTPPSTPTPTPTLKSPSPTPTRSAMAAAPSGSGRGGAVALAITGGVAAAAASVLLVRRFRRRSS